MVCYLLPVQPVLSKFQILCVNINHTKEQLVCGGLGILYPLSHATSCGRVVVESCGWSTHLPQRNLECDEPSAWDDAAHVSVLLPPVIQWGEGIYNEGKGNTMRGRGIQWREGQYNEGKGNTMTGRAIQWEGEYNEKENTMREKEIQWGEGKYNEGKDKT